MAHFAELNKDNYVLRVIVIDDKDTLDNNGIEKEEVGIAFCKSLFGENTRWIQTSYNHKIRGKFAGEGDIYDPNNDVFILSERNNVIIVPTDYIDAEIVEPTLAIEGN